MSAYKYLLVALQSLRVCKQFSYKAQKGSLINFEVVLTANTTNPNSERFTFDSWPTKEVSLFYSPET
jgi:hypothetical protein